MKSQRRATRDPSFVEVRLTGTREKIDELLKDLQTTWLYGYVSDFYPQRDGSYAVYIHLRARPGESSPA